MKKEGVIVEVNPNIPQPYLEYVQMRNGQIGKDIAQLCGYSFNGFISPNEMPSGDNYVVASKTLDRKSASELGIKETSDFYGLVVDSIDQAGKTVLHPAITKETPPSYNPRFAQKVSEYVLPGYTCFSKDEAFRIYSKFGKNGFGFRFKVANESDGKGQYKIEDNYHLLNILNREKYTLQEGFVLEANLNNPKTISVGFSEIMGQTFSFVSRQKNDSPDKEGWSSYLGGEVLVTKGRLGNLLKTVTLSADEQLAVTKALAFDVEYQRYINPTASRLSYDVVIGRDNYGNKLSGVTDITGRVGGTCPALMVACLAMKENQYIQTVQSEVTLNYDPTKILPEEEGAKRYVDHPKLRITARVNATD